MWHDYSKIGTVYKGSSLTVLETNDMWYHVKLNNGLGMMGVF
ncbi:MAG: SH3 domain-containing protein [Paeniclostridium sp.]